LRTSCWIRCVREPTITTQAEHGEPSKVPSPVLTPYNKPARQVDELAEDMDVVSSMVTDGLDISDEDKIAMNSSIATGAKTAIDNALWSSITLVIVGLTLFNFLRGGG
jgi:hypothetical protein